MISSLYFHTPILSYSHTFLYFPLTLRAQSIQMEFLKELGIHPHNAGSSTGTKWFDNPTQTIESFSPVNGKKIAAISVTTRENYDQIVQKAQEAYLVWRTWPAPKRGEIVRQLGEALREKKHALGSLVSYEMGKSLQEGLGEVQEMIDICDFAVGLSRQLHGLTMHSERPQHRMYEQWHPLGVVALFLPLISRLLYGAGTVCSPGFAEMFPFGRDRKKHRFVL